MSEKEEIVSTPDEQVIVRTRRRIPPAAIAAAAVTIVALGGFLLWWLAAGESGAGRPVPAPRSSTVDSPVETVTGHTLTLSPEQIKNADLSIETIGEQLSTESSERSATGSVEADQYRQTPVYSLAGGVVRRVVPQLGDNVARGQAVAVVFSDEFAQTQSRFIALRTEVDNARRNYERTQRLVAVNAPGRQEQEQATKQRKAAEAALSEMRSRYQRTSKLLEIGAASREELEQDNTKLRTAEAELEEARLRETRAGQLLAISPEVRAASEEALNKLRASEGELTSARQRLLLFGMPAGRIDALRHASHVTSELAVPAPASGTVTARSVNQGEVIEANKELMRVTDLSSVWVIAQVYEGDLAGLRTGSGASISTEAFPDRLFRGRITYIDPQIDETTRTAKVRIEVSNAGRELKLGMYVRVAFGATGDAERTVAVVPAGAVQNINGQSTVFLPTADPNVFELRQVRLGPEKDGRYAILEGLQVGDKVVVNGSFTLKAEWLKTRQSSEQSH